MRGALARQANYLSFLPVNIIDRIDTTAATGQSTTYSTCNRVLQRGAPFSQLSATTL
jgi:hypothetical protein